MPNSIRRSILLFALACFACGGASRSAAGKEDPEDLPGIVVDAPGEERPYFHDFGEVPRGDFLEHTFRLRNAEDGPVSLLDTQGTCSCTSVRRIRAVLADGTTVEGDPRKKDGMLDLPAGATAEMTVRMDSSKAAANHNKLEVLRLRTNSTRTPYLTFEVRFFPRQLFQATPSVLDLQDVPQGAGKSGRVDIVTGVKGSPARILGIAQQGERAQAELTETFSLDESLWVLTVTWPANQPMGAFKDHVVLSTTDANGKGDADTLEIPIWARVVSDIVIYPQQINLEALRQDESKTVRAELRALTPGLRTKVKAARVEGAASAQIAVSYEPLAPDALGRSSTWKLSIEVSPGLPPGSIVAELVVSLEDEQFPEVRASLRGYVR